MALSDLWRQHNEHRIFFPRLFILTDLFLFKGRNVFLFVSMLVLQAAHCSIFWRQVKKTRPLGPGRSSFCGVFSCYCSFRRPNSKTSPLDFRFVLFWYSWRGRFPSRVCSSSRNYGGDPGCPAGITAGSQYPSQRPSSPAIRYPVESDLARAHSAGDRFAASTTLDCNSLCTGLLVVWLYFPGYHLVPGHTNAGVSVRQPLEMIFYAAAYVAMPVSKLSHALGVPVGLVQMFFTAWLVVRLMFGRIRFHRLFLLALGNMVFIIATAFVTAAGRMALGHPEELSRYITPSLFFWSCFITICLGAGCPAMGRKGTGCIVASATATWFILAMVPMTLRRTQG